MLTTQFFTRVQLAKILGFKSDGSIKTFEKKGLIKPDIKPSKYSLNQVIFMAICKELSDFTNLSWKDFIDAKFNNVLNQNLLNFDLLIVYQYKNTDQPYAALMNNNTIAEFLNKYLDDELLDAVSKLNGRENTTYEDIPSFHIFNTKTYDMIIFSISRIHRKVKNKCTELKIDFKEKVTA